MVFHPRDYTTDLLFPPISPSLFFLFSLLGLLDLFRQNRRFSTNPGFQLGIGASQ